MAQTTRARVLTLIVPLIAAGVLVSNFTLKHTYQDGLLDQLQHSAYGWPLPFLEFSMWENARSTLNEHSFVQNITTGENEFFPFRLLVDICFCSGVVTGSAFTLRTFEPTIRLVTMFIIVMFAVVTAGISAIALPSLVFQNPVFVAISTAASTTSIVLSSGAIGMLFLPANGLRGTSDLPMFKIGCCHLLLGAITGIAARFFMNAFESPEFFLWAIPVFIGLITILSHRSTYSMGLNALFNCFAIAFWVIIAAMNDFPHNLSSDPVFWILQLPTLITALFMIILFYRHRLRRSEYAT